MGNRHFSKDDTAKQSKTDYFGGGGENLNASKNGKITEDEKIPPENTPNKMKKE